MKTKTRKTERNTKATGRDAVDVALLWTAGVCLFLMMLCVSVISPLAYIWTLGLVGCFAVGIGSVVIGGSLMSDGPIGWFMGAEVVKGGFELIGIILAGLVGISE